MNKKRREEIGGVVEKLNECIDTLDRIVDDENTTRENIPECFQSGDNYCKSEECSDTMEDATEDLRRVVESLEEITSN